MGNAKTTFRVLLAAVIIVPMILVAVFGFGIGGVKYKKYIETFDVSRTSTAGAEVRSYVPILAENVDWAQLSK
ncbi:MAG: hypothetical protein LBU41_06040, partial [Clostridiales Family XIII bacterium]|nr:hypothetical protein [Clostridiales Family XIII bacterium]